MNHRLRSGASRSGSSQPVALSQAGASVADEGIENEAGLFLAWDSARGAGADEADVFEAGGEATATGWDWGLWLLRDESLRREGWLRVNSEVSGAVMGESLLRNGYAMVKRAIDIVVAGLLLAALAPAFVVVCALIRLDSRGPAFFRQRRVGKDGLEFAMWKFRSMRVDAAPYAHSPTSDTDVRMTRVGRVIRRVSVDELPQLINVLRGEMSLVGPRPEMPFVVAGYSAREWGRLAVKPGITGLWQISPARAFPIHENVQFDLHYIKHRNLVLDGAILLRTVGAVVRGVGAV